MNCVTVITKQRYVEKADYLARKGSQTSDDESVLQVHNPISSKYFTVKRSIKELAEQRSRDRANALNCLKIDKQFN